MSGTVLDYAGHGAFRDRLWPWVRYSVSIMVAQLGMIGFCEWEAERYGRFGHWGSDRWALHTLLRVHLAGGRVAEVVLGLAVLNLLWVIIRQLEAQRNSEYGLRAAVVIGVAALPVVLQLVMIPMYASFAFE